MELIKTIKEAEKKAQQLIEQAKADAAENAEQVRLKQAESLEEADRERKKTVEQAQAEAKKQALVEAEILRAEAREKCRQMRNDTAGKIEKTVGKVMDYLKG